MTTPAVRPDLSRDEARTLTDQIKTSLSELLPMIIEAYQRRADLALGYSDWAAYCDGELHGMRLPVGDRREAVVEMREAGMPQRAIGAALGVGAATVNRDLSTVPDGTLPQRIQGLDGKSRPATAPKTAKKRNASPATTPTDESPATDEWSGTVIDMEPDEPAAVQPDEAPRAEQGDPEASAGEAESDDHPASLFPVDETEEEGDARRDRELDAAMANTVTRFRRNFSAAIANADDIWEFDVDRIIEAYSADYDRSVRPFLDRMTAWCAQVTEARRRASGLRLVAGGR